MRSRGKLPTLGGIVPTADLRIAKPAEKQVDPFYQSAAYLNWQRTVLRRANYRCEHTENGDRCERRHPRFRVYAHHIKERRDHPELELDPKNGMCLCAVHHGRVTDQARVARMRA